MNAAKAAKKCLTCNLDGASDCPGNCADYPKTSKLLNILQIIAALIVWVPIMVILFILGVVDWLLHVGTR